MAQLEFRDPPVPSPKARPLTDNDYVKNQDRDDLVRQLVQHPGRWAVVSRHLSQSSATKVARQLRTRFSGHDFAARTEPDGGGTVFARYAARSP